MRFYLTIILLLFSFQVFTIDNIEDPEDKSGCFENIDINLISDLYFIPYFEDIGNPVGYTLINTGLNVLFSSVGLEIEYNPLKIITFTFAGNANLISYILTFPGLSVGGDVGIRYFPFKDHKGLNFHVTGGYSMMSGGNVGIYASWFFEDLFIEMGVRSVTFFYSHLPLGSVKIGTRLNYF